jgi:biopolymer transport protein ExbD
MAFGRLERAGGNQPMADINMTPLIDVMLVLLVIFIISAPLLASSVRVELPQADAAPADPGASVLLVTIDRDGRLYLNDEPLDADALVARIDAAVARDAATELHLRADDATAYGRVAQLMAQAQKAGLTRIGFVTAPKAKPAR